jgi:hypothetical protein
MRNFLRYQHILKFSVAIPIRQQESSEFNIPQLSLVFGQMPELSFVRVQHIWAIQISTLCNFIFLGSTAYAKRLDEESYNYLMNRFGRTPRSYQPINVVLGTARERLAAMARTDNGNEVTMRPEEEESGDMAGRDRLAFQGESQIASEEASQHHCLAGPRLDCRTSPTSTERFPISPSSNGDIEPFASSVNTIGRYEPLQPERRSRLDPRVAPFSPRSNFSSSS